VQIRQVKIAILGAPGVGKISLVQQFVFNQWEPDYRSTKEKQFYYPSVIINNHLYELKLIDIPPIPFFPPDTLSEWRFCRGYGLRTASAYILVFDVSRAETFHYIRKLRDEITESRDTRDIPIFVAGNKHDLAAFREVPRREAAGIVKKQWKCGYLEVSAKFNFRVASLFKEMMKSIDYIDYGGNKPTAAQVMQNALRRNGKCVIL